MKKRVCLFFDRTYVDAHFCFREMVMQFLNKGWLVDLYLEFCTTQPVPCFPTDRIRIFFVRRSKTSLLGFLLRFLLGTRYDLVVATPQWALYWAVWTARLRKIPVVCLSDEIYSWDQIVHLSKNEVKPWLRKWTAREKWAHQKCAMTISLSEDRFQAVKKKNELPDRQAWTVIPNAPAGPSGKLQSSFYRERLSIGAQKALLLHSGSLDWNFTKTLIEASKSWGDNMALVFQMRTLGALNGFEKSLNVYFSDTTLPADLMRYATSSADIGLMLYNQSNFIEAVNGATAGKLGLYLGCGLPIIACNLEVLKWVEAEGCGVWVSQVSEIPEAAKKIMANYACYSENASRVFNERYEYSKHFNIFMEKLTESVI